MVMLRAKKKKRELVTSSARSAKCQPFIHLRGKGARSVVPIRGAERWLVGV